MATGFQTNNGLGPLQIRGRNGEWLNDCWKRRGGPGAYNNTAVHGCQSMFLAIFSSFSDGRVVPNFMIIYGPNSTTGYSSVILAIEK